MARFYIATRLERHVEHNLVRDILVAAGHTITYDWTFHGSVKNVGEERLQEVAQAEMEGVRSADFVVGLLPGGRGTHAEIGAAAALGKPMFLHTFPDHGGMFRPCSETCAFYWMPGTTRVIGTSVSEFAIQVVDKIAAYHTYLGRVVPAHLAHLQELPMCMDCPVGGREGGGEVCRRAPLCDWEAQIETAEMDRHGV